jgi:tRNA pseudouridine(38-40) synthase
VGAEKRAADPKGARSHGRKERTTFLAEIAYVGTHFSGLQRHPGQRTVVGCIEETVAPLVQSGAQAGAGPQIKSKRQACSLSIPGLAVSGRTDAGVSAYGQVLSLHTWNCRCVLSLHPCKSTCY